MIQEEFLDLPAETKVTVFKGVDLDGLYLPFEATIEGNLTQRLKYRLVKSDALLDARGTVARGTSSNPIFDCVWIDGSSCSIGWGEKVLFKCVDCGTEFRPTKESYRGGIGPLCASCFEEYRLCPCCSGTFAEDHMRLDCESEDTICEDCWHERNFTCQECSEDFSQSEGTEINGCLYCEGCRDDNFRTCDTCSTWLSCDDILYDEDGDLNLCPSCYQTEQRKKEEEKSKTFDINPFKRRVGIEIEGISLGSAPDLRPIAQRKSDGSLRPCDMGGYPFEMALNASSGDLLLSNIDYVCDELRKAKAYANESCGLHVHMDMNGEDKQAKENIFRAWSLFEPLFYGMSSKHRRKNSYCQSVYSAVKRQMDLKKQEGRDPNVRAYEFFYQEGDRYRTLNACALSKYGTMEVRIHEGTVNPEKIKDWVMFLLYFFEHFKSLEMTDELYEKIRAMPGREMLNAMFKMLPEVPRRLKKYVIRKLKKFSGKDSPFFVKENTAGLEPTGIALSPREARHAGVAYHDAVPPPAPEQQELPINPNDIPIPSWTEIRRFLRERAGQVRTIPGSMLQSVENLLECDCQDCRMQLLSEYRRIRGQESAIDAMRQAQTRAARDDEALRRAMYDSAQSLFQRQDLQSMLQQVRSASFNLRPGQLVRPIPNTDEYYTVNVDPTVSPHIQLSDYGRVFFASTPRDSGTQAAIRFERAVEAIENAADDDEGDDPSF